MFLIFAQSRKRKGEKGGRRNGRRKGEWRKRRKEKRDEGEIIFFLLPTSSPSSLSSSIPTPSTP